jgi:CheY-like chemotaxis protein
MARILLAEDDDAVRNLVERALAEDGHVLTVANDGALHALLRHSGELDLPLSDVKMPVMDGIESRAPCTRRW